MNAKTNAHQHAKSEPGADGRRLDDLVALRDELSALRQEHECLLASVRQAEDRLPGPAKKGQGLAPGRVVRSRARWATSFGDWAKAGVTGLIVPDEVLRRDRLYRE